MATNPMPPVLGRYTRPSIAKSRRRLAMALLVLIAIGYGFLFALGTTYVLVQLAAPLVAVAVLVIALLPDTGKAHVRMQERLLFAFVVGLLCWPDYIALALPGMPWITVIRMTTIPLGFVFLLNLSQSAQFRHELAAVLRTTRPVTILLLITTVIAFLSIAFSTETGQSINKFSVFVLSGVLVFFVAAYVFTKPGRITQLAWMIWAIVIFLCLIGFQEKRHEIIPWAGKIPSFLKVDAITSQQIFASKARAATGAYRVQSKFTTPLSFAEFLAMASPFIMHFMMTAKRYVVRIAAFLTLPVMIYTIIQTDSRLGFVGLFLAGLIYLLGWGALRWKTDRNSVFGPATVFSYPITFFGFILATFFVGRLRALVWGTGAQAASTQGREDQIAMGIPMILKHPWGYGIGRAAETLGFRDDDFLTIDSYYLSVALELGIIGFITYYATFLVAIWKSGRVALNQFDEDTGWLIPVLIALVNFVVIKAILSQQENHPLAFLLLGAAVALVYVIKRRMAEVPASA